MRETLCSRRGTAAAFAMALVTSLASHAQPAPGAFKTVNPGKLTVAAIGEMPASGMEGNKLVGTDGDIISLIAAKLGLEVQPVLMDAASTIEAVRSGRADVVIGNLRWTDKRAEVMSLTDPAYFVTYGMVTRKDSKLPSTITIADLKGAKLGTLTGASSSSDLKKVPDTTGVVFYNNSEAVLRDIIAGRIDFGVLDPTLIAYSSLKNPALNLKHVVFTPDPAYPILTSRTQSVFGVRLDNPDLLDAINAGLRWTIETGQARKAFAKYGLTSPDYFKPLDADPRIGVDRDKSGNVLGPAAHTPKDFGRLFH